MVHLLDRYTDNLSRGCARILDDLVSRPLTLSDFDLCKAASDQAQLKQVHEDCIEAAVKADLDDDPEAKVCDEDWVRAGELSMRAYDFADDDFVDKYSVCKLTIASGVDDAISDSYDIDGRSALILRHSFPRFGSPWFRFSGPSVRLGCWVWFGCWVWLLGLVRFGSVRLLLVWLCSRFGCWVWFGCGSEAFYIRCGSLTLSFELVQAP